jgi:hypothetical protein
VVPRVYGLYVDGTDSRLLLVTSYIRITAWGSCQTAQVTPDVRNERQSLVPGNVLIGAKLGTGASSSPSYSNSLPLSDLETERAGPSINAPYSCWKYLVRLSAVITITLSEIFRGFNLFFQSVSR